MATGESISLKWSQLIVSLIVLVLSAGVIYGSMKSRLDAHDDHFRMLDSDTVKKEQFEEMREDIRQRLQRIEGKIDRENLQRQVQDLDPAPKHQR